MSEFVASNGVGVRVDATNGDLEILGSGGSASDWDFVVNSAGTDALREFFLAERDAESGRWRSKEHPEYVVYKLTNSLIRVTNEATGEAVTFTQKVATGASASHSVAREFFAARPVSKPWHDAQSGEVWVIEAADWGTNACIVDVDYFTWAEHALPVKSEQITAGRRIYPEVEID